MKAILNGRILLPDSIRSMTHYLLENGVTGFLPTSLTVSWDILESTCKYIHGLMKESDSPAFSGSQILGMHMEGPFINPVKKDAQNPDYILAPDADIVLLDDDCQVLCTIVKGTTKYIRNN